MPHHKLLACVTNFVLPYPFQSWMNQRPHYSWPESAGTPRICLYRERPGPAAAVPGPPLNRSSSEHRTLHGVTGMEREDSRTVTNRHSRFLCLRQVSVHVWHRSTGIQWNFSWETIAARGHLSWKTRYCWRRVLRFYVIEPVTKVGPTVLPWKRGLSREVILWQYIWSGLAAGHSWCAFTTGYSPL